MEIWTDGACEPNPGLGGWGWHRSDGKQGCGGEEQTTNNRMEMTAILKALVELPDGLSVVIYSDSQYCVKGLTVWREGWKRKNWMKKNKPMPNRDLWVEFESHIERLYCRFEWVKGHNGDVNNDLADDLAAIGRSKLLQSDAIIESALDKKGENVGSIMDWRKLQKRAGLYEKLRRMNPREYAELYRRNIEGEGLFDDLLAKWPE